MDNLPHQKMNYHGKTDSFFERNLINMTPLIGFGIIVGVMILLCIIAIISYSIISAKNKHESSSSIPEGTDQSEFAKMLQDKYRTERDNGEFTRQDFN